MTGAPALSPAFRVIVLDYDGTLFDTRPAIIHCIQRAFEECGRPVPALDAIGGAVTTGATLADTLLLLDRRLRCDRSTLNELIVTYRKLYRDEGAALLRPFAGAAEALQQLHDGGTNCVVVSNKGIEAISRSFDAAGLSQLVDLIIADQPGIPKKPDPAIMTDLILRRYAQLRRDEILMVGDTEVDILFAKRAGVSSCWASYGYGEFGRCRMLKPEYEISSIGELPAVVFGVAAGRPDRLPR